MKPSNQRLLGLAIILFFMGIDICADAQMSGIAGFFNQHGAMMLLVDPETGAIGGANQAEVNY